MVLNVRNKSFLLHLQSLDGSDINKGSNKRTEGFANYDRKALPTQVPVSVYSFTLVESRSQSS